MPSETVKVTIIRPRRGWATLDLREIWEFRELLWVLVWRYLAVRYKQTAIGAAWALLQPLLAIMVFSVFFGRLANISSGAIPYPLFALAGLLPWQYFAKAVSEASTSLVANEAIISKVYFPRILLPTSVCLSGLIDLLVASSLLVVFMLYYKALPTLTILASPFFILLGVALALGLSLCLSALDVKFRDVRHALPFFIQLWFFATPVIYPANMVPGNWRLVYALNPMVSVIEGFRWSLLGVSAPPDPATLTISLVTVTAVALGGLVYFRRLETTIVDHL